MQGLTLEGEGPHHRQLIGHHLGGERMLFLNLSIGPSTRPVDFHHHRLGIVQHHLVDAVLVRTEGTHAPIHRQAERAQRIQHHIGREVLVRVLHTPQTRSCSSFKQRRIISMKGAARWRKLMPSSRSGSVPLAWAC